MTLCNQVFILFLLIGLGYFVARIGMISSEGSKQMSSLLIYVVTPCITIISFQQKVTRELVTGLLICTASAVSIHIIGIAVGRLIFNNRWPEPYRRVLRFATAYSNSGFMGLPLLQAILGAKGVIYGSVYMAVFNCFAYTHGILMYRSGGEEPNKIGKGKLFFRSVLNPNVAAIVVGVLLFGFSIRLPHDLYAAMNYVGSLNTPFSMIVIGTMFIGVEFKTFLLDKYLWPGLFMRNLGIPLLAVVLLNLFHLPQTLLTACLVQITCPVAGVCVIFAELFHPDSEHAAKFAAKLMALSTLLCIVTIPLMLLVSRVLPF